MAVTTATASTPLVETIVTDTTSDVTIETAATATQKLYFIEIDNPNGDAVYTKVFNTASGATVATQHYLQLPALLQVKLRLRLNQYLPLT